MKKKLLAVAAIVATVVGGLYAADHIDSPAVTGPNSTSRVADITDVYGFQSPENPNNLVLVCNTQGLLAPTATGAAAFATGTMYEFNIDNTGDNVEDLVIQCLFQGNTMRVYGPAAPSMKGLQSTVLTDAPRTETTVTTYGTGQPSVGTNANGVRIFAGPRDDPFFFDLARFRQIIGGTATSFRNPGVDTFAGTNVMAVVVEVPKSLLGGNGTLNVWAESKTK